MSACEALCLFDNYPDRLNVSAFAGSYLSPGADMGLAGTCLHRHPYFLSVD